MVRTSIAADTVDTLNVGVLKCVLAMLEYYTDTDPYLIDDTSNVFIQLWVSEVGDQTEALGLAGVDCCLSIANHVLVQHSPNVPSSIGVLGENILAAAKTTFLGSVPVELDGILEFTWSEVLVREKDAERLK